jgi:indole-3-glycerol phosphate synthase
MSSFLDRMACESRERVTQALRREDGSSLRRRAAATSPPPAVVLSDEGFDLIAEIKFRSPSSGPFVDSGPERDVAARARTYARGGAAVISVLTEPTAFGGTLLDLEAAAGATGVPVMRKDFLVDPYQIWEARACGASGVLLIARMLDDVVLEEMLTNAAEAGMFVLLETFDGADLDRAARARTARERRSDLWIGVNTRDLTTLSVDPGRLERLAREVPAGTIAVAESGLKTPADAAEAVIWGYRAALVGTALMRAADPEAEVAAMLRAGRDARAAALQGEFRNLGGASRPASHVERRKADR